LQEISGDDDVVDTSVGMIEMDESVVERQKMALETTGDVTTMDTLVDKGDSGDVMADETLGAVVSDEAILTMADEANHETAPIMADEASVGWTDETRVDTVDVAHVDTAREIVPVMADEASVGMADETCVDTAYEITPVVANSNLTIIAGSAAEDSHDQDANSVDSKETILTEPQPLQIIPFTDQHDESPVIDPVDSCVNHPFTRMTSIMEGISLFGVVPRFERVLREEGSPVVVGEHSLLGVPISSQVPTLEGTLAQDVESGDAADTEVLGVDTIPASDTSLVDKSKSPLLLIISFYFICWNVLSFSLLYIFF
jgi:hypothetical protein